MQTRLESPNEMKQAALNRPSSFPGRWLEAASLIFAPLLLLTGILLRIQFHFFFPQQLAAYHVHPLLMTAAYNCYLAGNILLWPAVVSIAKLISESRPGWAIWGGSSVMFGLFARAFHAGADYLAFQMTRIEGVQNATDTIASSYGSFHVVSSLNATILLGWVLLAVGAYLSRTLGLTQSASLGLMSALMIGVLKGSSMVSVISVSGLCVAFVPLGFRLLCTPRAPSPRQLMLGAAAGLALIAALFYFGQLGSPTQVRQTTFWHQRRVAAILWGRLFIEGAPGPSLLGTGEASLPILPAGGHGPSNVTSRTSPPG
jgi:hypothetical protein